MMMFNWDEQDQVEDIMWPDLVASEDHIVPHPVETEDNNLFSSENHDKNNDTESVISNMISTDINNNNTLINKLESSSDFFTNEELSSRAEVDSWLDLPDICLDLENKHNDGDNHVKLMMDNPTDANNLNPVGGDSMQLDFDPALIGHENRDSDAFLDCGWDDFQDFGDIEIFFRKDETILSQNKTDNAEGFHSQCEDVIELPAQPTPNNDLRLCKDQSSDEGCSSFLLDHQSEEQANSFRKQKENEEEMKIACEKASKERSKNKLPRSNKNRRISNSGSIGSITNPMQQSFHVSPVNLPMQFGESKLPEVVEHHTAFGTPTFLPYPYFQTNANQHSPVLPSQEIHLPSAEHGRNLIMTPQEKMEKLRRRQKMQARLAIEQQHQQFSHRISPIDGGASANFSVEKEGPKDVLFHLQEVVSKLDTNTRCCIRDSLSRLAKSAGERSIADKSSTSNSQKYEDDRVMRLEGTETETNPIDRVVANLLFYQRPTENFPRLGSSQPHSST